MLMQREDDINGLGIGEKFIGRLDRNDLVGLMPPHLFFKSLGHDN